MMKGRKGVVEIGEELLEQRQPRATRNSIAALPRRLLPQHAIAQRRRQQSKVPIRLAITRQHATLPTWLLALLETEPVKREDVDLRKAREYFTSEDGGAFALFFGQFSSTEHMQLCRELRAVTFDPGETVYRQGELVSHFYLVLEGVVERRRVARPGDARQGPMSASVRRYSQWRPAPFTNAAGASSEVINSRDGGHVDLSMFGQVVSTAEAGDGLAEHASRVLKGAHHTTAVAKVRCVLGRISIEDLDELRHHRKVVWAPGMCIRIMHKPSNERTPQEVNEVVNFIQPIRFFHQLSPLLQQEIAKRMSCERHSAGHAVCIEGLPGDTFHVILSGTVNVHSLAAVGDSNVGAALDLSSGRRRTELNARRVGMPPGRRRMRPSVRRTKFGAKRRSTLERQISPDVGRCEPESVGQENATKSDLASASRGAKVTYTDAEAVSTFGPVVCSLFAGDSFGERALLSNGIRTRTLVTTSDVELLTLHKHDYDLCVKPHHTDIAYSLESCQRALSKLPRERTAQDVKYLLELVQHIRFFRQLPRRLQEGLCLVMQVHEHEDEEIIFRQGEEGHTFHIILKGSVAVHVNGPPSEKQVGHQATNSRRAALQGGKTASWERRQSVRIRGFASDSTSTANSTPVPSHFAPDGFGACVATLFAGDSFGERSLLQHVPRSATVVTRERCEIIVLAKVDYVMLTRRTELAVPHRYTSDYNDDSVTKATEHQQRWIDVLQRAPRLRSAFDVRLVAQFCSQIRLFAQLPSSLLDNLCAVMGFEEFAAQEIVFEEGDPNDKFYVIISGSVSCHQSDGSGNEGDESVESTGASGRVRKRRNLSEDRQCGGSMRSSRRWKNAIHAVRKSVRDNGDEELCALDSLSGAVSAHAAILQDADADDSAIDTTFNAFTVEFGECVEILTEGDSFGTLHNVDDTAPFPSESNDEQEHDQSRQHTVITREPTRFCTIDKRTFHHHFRSGETNFVVNPTACFMELKKPVADRSETGIALLLKLLRSVKFFQQLPTRAQRQLCQVIGYKQVQPDECVIRQGQTADTFYVIVSGRAEVRIADAHHHDDVSRGRTAQASAGSGRSKTSPLRHSVMVMEGKKRRMSAIRKLNACGLPGPNASPVARIKHGTGRIGGGSLIVKVGGDFQGGNSSSSQRHVPMDNGTARAIEAEMRQRLIIDERRDENESSDDDSDSSSNTDEDENIFAEVPLNKNDLSTGAQESEPNRDSPNLPSSCGLFETYGICVGELGRGDAFGETALVRDQPYRSSVLAAGGVLELMTIAKGDFENLIAKMHTQIEYAPSVHDRDATRLGQIAKLQESRQLHVETVESAVNQMLENVNVTKSIGKMRNRVEMARRYHVLMQEVMKRVPLFNNMSRDELRRWLGVLRYSHYEEGDTIFEPGDEASHFFVVCAGTVALSTKLTGNICVVTTGESFGWLALLEPEGQRSITAKALQETECVMLGAVEYHSEWCKTQFTGGLPEKQRHAFLRSVSQFNTFSPRHFAVAMLSASQVEYPRKRTIEMDDNRIQFVMEGELMLMKARRTSDKVTPGSANESNAALTTNTIRAFRRGSDAGLNVAQGRRALRTKASAFDMTHGTLSSHVALTILQRGSSFSHIGEDEILLCHTSVKLVTLNISTLTRHLGPGAVAQLMQSMGLHAASPLKTTAAKALPAQSEDEAKSAILGTKGSPWKDELQQRGPLEDLAIAEATKGAEGATTEGLGVWNANFSAQALRGLLYSRWGSTNMPIADRRRSCFERSDALLLTTHLGKKFFVRKLRQGPQNQYLGRKTAMPNSNATASSSMLRHSLDGVNEDCAKAAFAATDSSDLLNKDSLRRLSCTDQPSSARVSALAMGFNSCADSITPPSAYNGASTPSILSTMPTRLLSHNNVPAISQDEPATGARPPRRASAEEFRAQRVSPRKLRLVRRAVVLQEVQSHRTGISSSATAESSSRMSHMTSRASQVTSRISDV